MYALRVLPKISVYALRFFASYFAGNAAREGFFEAVYRYHYARTRNKIKIPVKTLIDISNSIAPIEPVLAQWQSGNMAAFELCVICALAAKKKPARVFEFGTFNGRTTLNIARNLPSSSQIVTLDINDNDATPALICDPQDYSFIHKRHGDLLFNGTKHAGQITILKGDSATYDFSAYNGSIDMVLIDGSHSPQYVINDTEKALKLVGPKGGLIIWHDYNGIYWQGVTSVLDNYYLTDSRFKNIFSIENTSLAVLEINTV